MSLKLPGLGPKTEIKLKKLGIESETELLYHFPHRYLDFSKITPISQLNFNESTTISGQIIHLENIYTRSGKTLQKIILSDSTGTIELIWFNQPFLVKNFKIGETWAFAGFPSLYKGKTTIFAPEYGQYHTGKIIPIYPETKGLTSRWFRKNISLNLSKLISTTSELLPKSILTKYKLSSLDNSLAQIHFPKDQSELESARLRLSLDEILSLLARSYLERQSWASFTPKFTLKNYPTTELINSLPFKLTPSQLQAWKEIRRDLISKTKVMNRLLSGDVGSGKTIIALLSSYLVSQNHHQSLILAPTEILAKQHYTTFKKFLPKVPLFLLTAKNKINSKLPNDAIIIATHAALFQKEKFIDSIALLVIDEQHKFGVKQRSFLGSQNPPHTLSMTATPIPRTISLTLLGNLDISTLSCPPKNRPLTKTFLVPNNKIPDCYSWLQQDIILRQTQAFIVCPFIEESESITSIKSAKKEFERLVKLFPKLKLALIHGKTEPETRNKILDDFKHNKINILVTTPIIEVGIDYPNATTIIIESADRFGLSQLHQLRGRVGRGELQSYCYLFTESQNDPSLNRLKYLEKTIDGFKIADYDLKTRGPGESFSTLQHGFPSLKIANLSDLKLINLAKKIFQDLITKSLDFDLKKLTNNKNTIQQYYN
ncbi:ATP-dependent DNA helicase RecG [Candidatus Shapirobacteria bacterium]|nr:ATP-dependent DNA helicase RecG [Candidatus Shapirobacteria bacterium]